MRSIVIAPARTGRAKRSKIAVIIILQGNKFIRSIDKPDVRVLITVVMKLIAPNREEIPAKWSEKIAISTAGPEWPKILLSGG